jgi:hypothetical protein
VDCGAGILPPTERVTGERWTVAGIPPPTERVKGGLWLEYLLQQRG